MAQDPFSQYADQTGDPFAAFADKPATPAQPLVDRPLGWRDAAATGVRVLAPFLAMEGGPMGAAVGGLGETAAEMLEKSTWDPRQVNPGRVALEATAGAIPASSLIKGGRYGASALRSALMGAGREAGSELIDTGDASKLDPTRIAFGGALGAAGGLAGARLTPVNPEEAAAAAQKAADKAKALQQARIQAGRRDPLQQQFEDAMSKRNISFYDEQAAAQKAADREAIRAAKEAAKQRAEDLAQQRAQEEITARGWVEKTPTISEAATGKLSMRIPYGTLSEDEEAIAKSASQTLGQPAQAPVTEAVPTPPAAPAPVPGPEGPEASVANFFRTPQGAAGANYRAAQEAAAAGEIPSAQAARASRLLTIPGREEEGLAGLREALAPKAAPELAEGGAPKLPTETPVAATGPETPAPSTTGTVTSRPMTDAETAQQQWIVDEASKLSPEDRATFVDRMKQSGGFATAQLLKALGGAAIGAPTGAAAWQYLDPEDPTSLVKGALAGAAVGAGLTFPVRQGATKLDNIIAWRNAGLLADISPQLKKHIADLGAFTWEIPRQIVGGLTGEIPGGVEQAQQLIAAHPLNPMNLAKTASRYWAGLGENPDIGASIGDVVKAASESPLGWVARPFNAAMYTIQEALKDAGITDPNMLKQLVGTSAPETAEGRWWLSAQNLPLVRYLRPFARVQTNIAEGIRNVPGLSMVAGDPATKWTRGIVGGAQMGLGGLEELREEAREQEGDPVGRLQKALLPAAMGVRGTAPFLAGKALASAASGQGSARSLFELIRALPGTQAALPEPYPTESADKYMRRLLRAPVAAMTPSALTPESPSVR